MEGGRLTWASSAMVLEYVVAVMSGADDGAEAGAEANPSGLGCGGGIEEC
jgi:hypothetical protein